MNISEAIATRRSRPMLSDPAPSTKQISEWLTLSLNAPDHGRLKPIRTWVLTGDDLIQLGEWCLEATLAEKPDLTSAQQDKIKAKPLRAPMVIVIAAEIKSGHKIPEIEQKLCVGTFAHNLSLLIHSNQFGSIWRSGDLAYSPILKSKFGLTASDEIIGFLYIGTPGGVIAPKPESIFTEHVKFGLGHFAPSIQIQ